MLGKPYQSERITGELLEADVRPVSGKASLARPRTKEAAHWVYSRRRASRSGYEERTNLLGPRPRRSSKLIHPGALALF